MSSEKRLSSVCHSMAHHAVSNLSYLHPHLRQACREISLSSINLDLISDEPYPPKLQCSEELKLATNALRRKFEKILKSEGFDLSCINAAQLHFEFTDEFLDDYCSICHAHLVAKSGREFLHAVNYLGSSIVPIPASNWSE